MAEAFERGCAALDAGNAPAAKEAFDLAIDADDTQAAYFERRCAAQLQLKATMDALMDAETAAQLASTDGAFLLKLGRLLFAAGQHDRARQMATRAHAAGAPGDAVKALMAECDAVLGSAAAASTAGGSVSAASQEQTPAAVPAAESARIKHDWYQTPTHVVVTVMIKKLKQEDVKIEFTEKSVSLDIKLHTGSDYNLELDLWGSIVPEESTIRVIPVKVELKLKKAAGGRWEALEGDGTAVPAQAMAEVTTADPAAEPAAEPTPAAAAATAAARARQPQDWDQLARQVEEEEKGEKVEGDQALNKLFQQIYGDADEDTRRAMMKSFYESSGTVLSTNWKEVGAKKVETKPPDGVQFKKWSA